jgi:hypothetical protein
MPPVSGIRNAQEMGGFFMVDTKRGEVPAPGQKHFEELFATQ